jgi:hypothetical protein
MGNVFVRNNVMGMIQDIDTELSLAFVDMAMVNFVPTLKSQSAEPNFAGTSLGRAVDGKMVGLD